MFVVFQLLMFQFQTRKTKKLFNNLKGHELKEKARNLLWFKVNTSSSHLRINSNFGKIR